MLGAPRCFTCASSVLTDAALKWRRLAQTPPCPARPRPPASRCDPRDLCDILGCLHTLPRLNLRMRLATRGAGNPWRNPPLPATFYWGPAPGNAPAQFCTSHIRHRTSGYSLAGNVEAVCPTRVVSMHGPPG